MLDAVETRDGDVVIAPAGLELRDGPAFITFHEHAADFDGQENIGLTAAATVDGRTVHLRIERALSDFGISRSPLRSTLALARAGRRLRRRLTAEADRRDVLLPRFAELDFVRPPRRARR